MNRSGYQIWIVIWDRDYPMSSVVEVDGWEAGWYGWTGKPGDVPPTIIDEYQDALATAEALSVAEGA